MILTIDIRFFRFVHIQFVTNYVHGFHTYIVDAPNWY